jgi:tRNA A37 threonylcarbamoyltransferase TsaD
MPSAAKVCYTVSYHETKERATMRPLQISLETAQKLSKALGMPIEQIMHMPQHILVQKLLELEKAKKKEE